MTGPYLDTSALAKWYLNEPLSEAVEEYLQGLPYAQISSLTKIELRCLLARRRRYREISPEMEMRVQASFEQDIRGGHLRVLPLADDHVEIAMEVMALLPEHPLRTLDALHLAIARSAGLETVATADRVMAAATAALGLEVERFLPDVNDQLPSPT